MPETAAGSVTLEIVVVEDHPLFRDALRAALTPAYNNITMIEAASLKELDQQLSVTNDVDLILLDLTMPDVRGLAGLLYVRGTYPQIPVMIVSANEDTTIMRQAIQLGASGFVPKSQPLEKLREAVSSVLRGTVWVPDMIGQTEEGYEPDELVCRVSRLSPQQLRVLMMLGEGLLNKQIAHKLNVAEATVKAHVSAVMQKLGVNSRTQAVIAASRIGAPHGPTFAESLANPSDP